MATRYWDELITRLSALPNVRTRIGKTRVSYWRPDKTRFCKVEEYGGSTTLVLNEVDYSMLRPQILNSEPDQDNRIRIYIVSKSMLELAIEFAISTYNNQAGSLVSPSGDLA